jgi:GTP diphosphokinase / guanosine-3',5'-bis(diphosphate) 3'-diphosphatase
MAGTPEAANDPIAFILEAMAFAAEKHRSQRRKDVEASPYINHPIALAHLLANEAGIRDPLVLAAAILHDTVEDTDTTLEEIAARFGDEVGSVVEEVTDDQALSRPERKRLQVEHAASLSFRAQQLKLADKICNLRDVMTAPPAGWSLERKREYFDWAKQVAEGLRGRHPVLEALFDEVYALRP